MNWKQTKVLVTGGASLIGSPLVHALIGRGARLRVVDNLTSGMLENLQSARALAAVELVEADLLEEGAARRFARGMAMGEVLAN